MKSLGRGEFFVIVALLFAITAVGCEVSNSLAQEPEKIEVTLDHGTPWEPPVVAMLTDDMCSHLPRFIDNHGSEPLPPGFPTSGDMQEILDWSGLEVSRRYGCMRAEVGGTYLSLEAIELKCGPAVVQARVDNEQGPMDGVLLFMNWPNMGDANQFPPEGVDPPYFGEGIGGFTDGGGSVGWGYGGGSYITPGVGGPFSVWGSSCVGAGCRYGEWVGSDALLKTGWMATTNHCTFNPWFEPVKVTGAGSVPPGVYSLVNIDEEGNIVGEIIFNDGTPPGGKSLLGLMFGEEMVGWLEWSVPQ